MIEIVIFDSNIKLRGTFRKGYEEYYAKPSKHSECFLDWLCARFIGPSALYSNKESKHGIEISKDSAKEISKMAEFFGLKKHIERYNDGRIKKLSVYSDLAESYTAGGKLYYHGFPIIRVKNNI